MTSADNVGMHNQTDYGILVHILAEHFGERLKMVTWREEQNTLQEVNEQ